MRVKCLDNTLQKDKLRVGHIYEVASIDLHYNTVKLVGLEDQNFTKSRFVLMKDEPDVGSR